MFGTEVLRPVYDLGGDVGRFFGGYVEHALLGETGSDNLLRKVSENGFVFGPNPSADMDVKFRVAPGEHVFDNGVVDLPLFFQHLEDFVLEDSSRSSAWKPGTPTKEPSGRKQPSVTMACRCGLGLKKSPYVCMAMLAPGTAPSRGTAYFKKALVTFHAHLLNLPSRERSHMK